jgi:hypothetical protein
MDPHAYVKQLPAFMLMGPHPLSNTRAKTLGSSVDKEQRILFDLRNRSAWFPTSKSLTNPPFVRDSSKAKEYEDSYSFLALDRRRHVRMVSAPPERFLTPQTSQQAVGWHVNDSVHFPVRDSDHKISSSPITQYYMNMALTKSHAILRFSH